MRAFTLTAAALGIVLLAGQAMAEPSGGSPSNPNTGVATGGGSGCCGAKYLGKFVGGQFVPIDQAWGSVVQKSKHDWTFWDRVFNYFGYTPTVAHYTIVDAWYSHEVHDVNPPSCGSCSFGSVQPGNGMTWGDAYRRRRSTPKIIRQRRKAAVA